MMRLPLSRAFLALALSATVLAAQARTVYRWVDSDGAEHFSDVPVSGAEAVWVPDSLVSKPLTPPPSAETEQPEDESDIAALDPDSPQAAALRCKQKKDELTRYQNSASIVERDAMGNEHEYSPQERAQLMLRTREAIAALCAE